MDVASNRVFVRNLPFTCTDNQLEELFSDQGPVKNCFVVSQPGAPGRCKGFGFVTFAAKEDVAKVLGSQMSMEGRKLEVFPANKKEETPGRSKKRAQRAAKDAQRKGEVKDLGDVKKSENEIKKRLAEDPDSEQEAGEGDEAGSDEDSTEGSKTADRGQKRKSEDQSHLKNKRAKVQEKTPEAGRDIEIRNIPARTTTEDLKKFFQQFGEVRNCKLVRKKDVNGMGRAFVTFGTQEASTECFNMGNRKDNPLILKGSSLVIARAVPLKNLNGVHNAGKSSDQTERKPHQKFHPEGRILIRNLSFDSTKVEIREEFSKFGNILQVTMPMNQASKFPRNKGFAFVQYEGKEEAEKAIQEMNTKLFHGRPVAVDKAMPKNEYKVAKREVESTQEKAVVKEKENAGDVLSEDEDEDETEDEVEDEVEDEGEGEEDDKKEGLESEEESNGDDDDADDDEVDEEEGDDDDDDESNEEDEEDEEDMETGPNESDKNMDFEDKEDETSKDIKEERTVFIKNLPYEVRVPEIIKVFKKFGSVKFCALVKDPVTEQPKGTAFLQFHKKECADKCLQETAEKEDSLELHGRRLIVAKALSRHNAAELQEKRKKLLKMAEKDKRNLYLLKEGFIRPGTEAAAGLSKSDIDKRSKIETVKRAKIKNMYIFVSKTRLVVHNLPMSCNDKKLKELFRSAVKAKEGVSITEARVMRDKNNLGEDKKGKPLGYGFVSFSEHSHALEALRTVNNNPEYYGENKRPIVGFSLENMKALEKKRRQGEKSKMKLGETPAGKAAEKTTTKTTVQIENDPRAEMLDKVKTGPFKHPNAKLRWRDKGKREAEARKEKLFRRKKLFKQQAGRKESQGRKESVRSPNRQGTKQETSKKRRVSKDVKEERKFDSLVAKYKSKINESMSGKSGSKWFE